ncbi:hypothetical protein BT96DRAFT_972688 [Gymnopus androsaceus JB14]|uniref:Uncharacterized protein n=1 Tax=Gymnopus androsaceus JB14 TaxID=1447944 RepID=A0A6A4I8I6_9AGAR|nr:hypothetical protein BT96DRAFT_972688 [Gymnopus androsaceus JB14]
MDEYNHSETSSIITSARTISSSSTIPGLGALSGRAITALGSAVINGVESILIRRRLAQIENIFERGLPQSSDDLRAIYSDLLELSRPPYSRSLQTRALQLIQDNFGNMEIEGLTTSENCSTETSSIFTSTGPYTSSSSTIPGLGAHSGKAIKRLGSIVVVHGINGVIGRWKLAQIKLQVEQVRILEERLPLDRWTRLRAFYSGYSAQNLDWNERKGLYTDVLSELFRHVYSLSIRKRARDNLKGMFSRSCEAPPRWKK